MYMICSLKSYYKDNKLSSTLVNLFFLVVVLIYLIPFYINDIIFDYIYNIFQLDYGITESFILIFMMMYGLIMFDNRVIKGIYVTILFFNLSFTYFATIMGSYQYSYKVFLPILLQIILLSILGLVYYKSKKYECIRKYKTNTLVVFISIIIPLFLLSFFGKLISSFII
ncbi:hypothetical protein [Senegalia massiliensis]|uniref:Uncharacterized protein n=1 Tax=Senegalia massiliensis TaxID=1720316 RepID=A0A845R310_9CLOT|nr:hypothetical protein [Senegalia massiliensis]NBI08349.1 hypothetical protein [Senegalia massiliensis]